MLAGRAIPETVTAAASTGVAQAQLGRAGVEDTITLLVTWRNASGTAGHSVFTSSWVAPTADCHTQQNFHFMGHGGEIRADQAHRGYSVSADAASGGTGGLAAVNPLYMRYVPDAAGRFAGQTGYGYRSIEAFVDACSAMRAPGASVQEVSATLASVAATLQVTAILEAGRRSLDAGGRPVKILYKSSGSAAAEGGVDVLAKPCGFE
jgi:D-galacturonate reductase